MNRELWRQDLAWAAFLFVLAVAFGLMEHWPLVRLSLQGELPGYLEKLKERQRQVQFQGVKTVSLSQAYAAWQQGRTLFIDSRNAQEFSELHIPGALHLPPEKLEASGLQALGEVAKDRQIVVYCGHAACDAALKVAEKLQSQGFSQVSAFLGGFRAWDEAGYPVDTCK
jgi:rhodanese-related sulfurtransferase